MCFSSLDEGRLTLQQQQQRTAVMLRHRCIQTLLLLPAPTQAPACSLLETGIHSAPAHTTAAAADTASSAAAASRPRAAAAA